MSSDEAPEFELMCIPFAFKFACYLDVQIVSLLLESGVEINLRNYRGQVCSISRLACIEFV